MKIIRTSITRTIAAAALAGAASLGTLTSHAGSAGASSNSGYVGGGWGNPIVGVAYNPGSVFPNVFCSSYRIEVSVGITAEAGYVNGQWVSYRYWVKNRGTGWNAYSTYAPAQLAHNYMNNTSYPVSMFATSPFNTGSHSFWDVQIEVIRWNGSQWISRWYWPSGGYRLQNGSYNSAYCPT
jgi:hypothetical protein